MSKVITEKWCFNSQARFNGMTVASLNIDIRNISKIIIKITLPSLPTGFSYITNPIYNLINKVSMEINGQELFHFDGSQLANNDMNIYKDFSKFNDECKIIDNIISYPIDLVEIWELGTEGIIDASYNSVITERYNPIHYGLYFNCAFNGIENIIKCDPDVDIKQLFDLELDAYLLYEYPVGSVGNVVIYQK